MHAWCCWAKRVQPSSAKLLLLLLLTSGGGGQISEEQLEEMVYAFEQASFDEKMELLRDLMIECNAAGGGSRGRNSRRGGW